jgi:uncharacterized membrane protein YhaH (DUF805 family)
MGFGEAIKVCFGKYATFAGRARRSEFWWFALFNLIVTAVLNLVDNAVGLVISLGSQGAETAGGLVTFSSSNLGILSSVWFIIVFLPYLSVTVRRLHDTGRSGWWWWIILVPCVGFIVLLVFMLIAGDPRENRFGPDPKAVSPSF